MFTVAGDTDGTPSGARVGDGDGAGVLVGVGVLVDVGVGVGDGVDVGVGVGAGVGVAAGVDVGAGVEVGVGDGVGSGCPTTMRANPYVTPPTSVSGGGVAANEIVRPAIAPGPRIVIQPAAGFVGSNSATYVTADAAGAMGETNVKLSDVGNVTVTDGVIVTNASACSPFAPIVAGRRRTLCTCGKTAGNVACNVAASVATAFAGGAMMLPLKPPVTGGNAIDAGPCGVATVEPLATGGNVGVGDAVTTAGGVADEPPPPHPTAHAASASIAAEYFAVRHEPMS